MATKALLLVLLAGVINVDGYGPPPAKGGGHRTTTTTTEGPGQTFNEIPNLFGDSASPGNNYIDQTPSSGSYSSSSTYSNSGTNLPGSSVTTSGFWWQGPNSPFNPTNQGPAPAKPGQGFPGAGGCGGAAGCVGVGYQPTPTNPTSNKPINIQGNPFLSSALGTNSPQYPTGGPSSSVSCNTPGFVCVPKDICYNGVVSENGIYQIRQGATKCNTAQEACCRLAAPGSSPGSNTGVFPSGSPGSPGYTSGSSSSETHGSPVHGSPTSSSSNGFPSTSGTPGSPSYGSPSTGFPVTSGSPGSPGYGSPSGSPGSPGYGQPSSLPNNGFPQTSGTPGSPGYGSPSGLPNSVFPGTSGTSGSPSYGGSSSPGFGGTPSGLPSSVSTGGSSSIYTYGSGSPGFPGSGSVPTGGSYNPTPRPVSPVTSPRPYTGPLNTTPYPGCAAALKCVQETYCTAEGVMSDTPVFLTREQQENKVPLTECMDMATGIIGKCCRDPNYKDPWPGGMMMMKNTGFDDGQYHPDGAGTVNHNAGLYYNTISSTPSTPQKAHTIKKPLGVFGQTPSPFPSTFSSSSSGSSATSGTTGTSGTTYQSSSFPQTGPSGQSSLPNFGQVGQPQKPNFGQVGQPQQPNFGQVGQPQKPNFGQVGQPQQPNFGQPGQSSYSPQPTVYSSQSPSLLPSSSQKPFPPPFPGSSPTSTDYSSGSPGTIGGVFPGQTQGSSSYTPSPAGGPNPSGSCGVRKESFNSPVDAGFEEFPWQALVVSATNRSSLCSAAIISDSAVITSAHCVENSVSKDLLVKAGEWKLNSGEHPKPVQVRPVIAIARHPGYNSVSLSKDLAILVIGQPFTLDSHVDKICLPQSSSQEYLPTGRTCVVTGWGKVALSGQVPDAVLHKVDVKVVPAGQCENQLKQTHLGKYFILNQGFSCATPSSGVASDLCKVDIGGPLACDRGDGHYELAGVNSWDIGCEQEVPTVFATCDSSWIYAILEKPPGTLISEEQAYNSNKSKGESLDGVDIDQKPGFALGYGKK